MKYIITTLKNHQPHTYTLQASSPHQAKSLALLKDNLPPLKVSIAPPLLKLPIPTKHLILYAKQMQLMTQANLPIDTALDLARAHCNHQHLAFILDSTLNHLQNGMSLSQSLTPFASHLGNLLVKIIEVGAKSQNLSQSFDLIALHLKRKEQNRNKIKKALTYPIFILIAMLLAIASLFHFLIPQLLTLFSEHPQELPIYTKALITCYHFLTQYGMISLLTAISLGLLGMLYYAKRGRFFTKTEALFFRIPFCKSFLKHRHCYDYFLALSMLVKCKLPLDEAMRFAQQSLDSHLFQQRLESAYKELQAGQSLSYSLQKCQLFDSLLLSLLEISQTSGNIQEILELCASHYEEKLENLTQQSIALIEPALTLIMGLCVLFLALAIFTPLQSLNQIF